MFNNIVNKRIPVKDHHGHFSYCMRWYRTALHTGYAQRSPECENRSNSRRSIRHDPHKMYVAYVYKARKKIEDGNLMEPWHCEVFDGGSHAIAYHV